MKLPPLPSCLGLLRFHVDSSIVTLQPKPLDEDASAPPGKTLHSSSGHAITTPGPGGKALLPTLRVDLKTGKSSCSWARALESETSVVLGVAGMIRLQEACIMVLVTHAKRVACVWGQPIYKVTKCHLVVHEAMKQNPSDLRYASMLQQAYDPDTYGGHMYFSHTAPIASSTQRQAGASHRYLWSASNPRFVWNSSLMRLLIDAGAEPFALPIMVGYVSMSSPASMHVRPSLPPKPTLTSSSDTTSGSTSSEITSGAGDAAAGDTAGGLKGGLDGGSSNGLGGGVSEAKATIALIARVAPARISAGQWRRGLDIQGNAAGFVETEFIFTLHGSEKAISTMDAKPQTPSSDTSAEHAATDNGTAGVHADVDGETQPSETATVSTGQASAANASDVSSGVQQSQTQQKGPRLMPRIISHVQVRGSTPVCWCQPPNLMWPAPSPSSARVCTTPDANAKALRQHMAGLWRDYGQSLTLLNLILTGRRHTTNNHTSSAAASSSSSSAAASTTNNELQNLTAAASAPRLRYQLQLHSALSDAVASLQRQQRQQASGTGRTTASGKAVKTTSVEDATTNSDHNHGTDGKSGSDSSAATNGGATSQGPAGNGVEEDGVAAVDASKQNATPLAPPSASTSSSGPSVSIVGHLAQLPLELATCGGADAFLEVLGDAIQAHGMCIVETPPDHPAVLSAAAVSSAPATRPPLPLPRPLAVQTGVVRTSAAGGSTAGVCIGEVDIAQHALAQRTILPAMLHAAGVVGGPSCPSSPSPSAPSSMASAPQSSALSSSNGEDETVLRDLYCALSSALSEMWSRMSGRLADQFLGIQEGDAGRLLHHIAEWGPPGPHHYHHGRLQAITASSSTTIAAAPSSSIATSPSAPSAVTSTLASTTIPSSPPTISPAFTSTSTAGAGLTGTTVVSVLRPISAPWGGLRSAWGGAVRLSERVALWYYSNFADGPRQDALDLATGGHVPAPGQPCPQRAAPNTMMLQVGIILAAVALVQALLVVFSSTSGISVPYAGIAAGLGPLGTLQQVGTRVGLPAVIAVGLLWGVVARNARDYIERPALCPDAVRPWI